MMKKLFIMIMKTVLKLSQCTTITDLIIQQDLFIMILMITGMMNLYFIFLSVMITDLIIMLIIIPMVVVYILAGIR